MSQDLRDKVALVTGGASGLGLATATALAEAGAHLVVADVDERGAEVAARLGGHFVATDVADLDANRAMVEFAVAEAGGIDLAFLNAGVASGCGVLDDFDPERYRRAMGINLDGVVYGTHAVVPALKAGGGGALVATASLAGLTGTPMDPIYSANKHAVVGLVRSLGPVLATDGIRFNAVCPGYAESALVAPFKQALLDMGFEVMPAEDVARAVMTLFTNDAAGECWFVQPRREAAAFAFRGIPGPGNPPSVAAP